MNLESAPGPSGTDPKQRQGVGPGLPRFAREDGQAARRSLLQRLLNATPRWVLYIGGAMPGVWIFWLALNDELGADPVKSLEHRLGLWTLRFIIAGLTVTPLRRLGGPNLIRFRRALGLLAFFYALSHLLAYIVFDRGLDANEILADILKRPYITIGMFAFAILVPLAVTSNAAMIKRLGAAAWQKLHRWIYVAAIAAVAHFIMSVKSWPAEPLIYAAIVATLLLMRAAFAARKLLSKATPRAA
jgi:methionine sulfoxide reductase heme-binding subunit